MRAEDIILKKQRLFGDMASVELAYKGYTISMAGSPANCSVDIIPWKGAAHLSPGIRAQFTETGTGDAFLNFDPLPVATPADILSGEIGKAFMEAADVYEEVRSSWDILKTYLTEDKKKAP